MEKIRNDKKRKIVIFVLPLFITIVLLLVLGKSFALWNITDIQNTANIVSTGCVNISLDYSGDVVLKSNEPLSDTNGKKLVPFTFKVINKCDKKASYVLNLETLSKGENVLDDSNVKVSLINGENEVFLSTLTTVHENQEKILEEANKAYKLDEQEIEGKQTISYSLRLWIDSSVTNTDQLKKAIFNSKVTLIENYKQTNILYEIVQNQASLDNASSKFVTASTGIDFSAAPSDTNGKGVYTIASTKDYKYPVHYFRGAVTNNNIKFANICWKIVRTTETGGVKLIYNGTPNETGGCTNTTGTVTQIGTSAFNTSSNSGDYVGYMYPSTNANNSTIKTTIDTWYQNNMTAYTEKLEDTVWCNDRSVYKTEGSNIYYGARQRNVDTKSPSIVCPNDNDKFTVNSANGNGKLTYPVALLTADEATLAGHGYPGYSNTSYLYTSQWWWALSPSHFLSSLAFGFSVTSGGNLSSYFVDRSDGGVRPSVSLAPGTMVSDSGDGSQNSPYEILIETKTN